MCVPHRAGGKPPHHVRARSGVPDDIRGTCAQDSPTRLFGRAVLMLQKSLRPDDISASG